MPTYATSEPAISDPVISSTLDQIVNTLSAYQSTQSQYNSSVRKRRKNTFVASPKFNPEVVEQVANPQRIRAILAILENDGLSEDLQSSFTKRDIQDVLEYLDEELVKEEEALIGQVETTGDIEIDTFFRR